MSTTSKHGDDASCPGESWGFQSLQDPRWWSNKNTLLKCFSPIWRSSSPYRCWITIQKDVPSLSQRVHVLVCVCVYVCAYVCVIWISWDTTNWSTFRSAGMIDDLRELWFYPYMDTCGDIMQAYHLWENNRHRHYWLSKLSMTLLLFLCKCWHAY